MRIFLALAMVIPLASCSGAAGSLGNLNLFGWLGGKSSQTQVHSGRGLEPRGGYPADQESRPLAGQISELMVDRTPSGIILSVTSHMPSEGYHSAELVFSGITERGVISYDLRARGPDAVYRNVPEHLRELVVSVHLTRAQLHGIRRIKVQAANNSRTIRP